jgi:hypothetical protein
MEGENTARTAYSERSIVERTSEHRRAFHYREPYARLGFPLYYCCYGQVSRA